MDASLMKPKYGMFIHWGIYSILEYHEQVAAHKHMTHDEYEPLAKVFNPTEYDPEEWVLLAKKAGMEYICFTAKHHDGYCMWDSKYTDYKVTNSPYGKDVLKMLADACHKHGIKLSIYYSNPDWHYEYGYNPHSTHQWLAKNKDNPDTEKLRDYIKNQITELLTNYGKIYTLFWDIPPKFEDRSVNELARKLQPDIIINDRGFDEGDFSTPERDYEKLGTKRFAKATEACNSVGVNSWGYRRGENFYSVRYLMRSIDKIMAMGGSYLLNVGPNSKGVITEEYKSRILKIADWYNRMEGALCEAEPDETDYGVYKNEYLATKKNGKTYLHFYDGLIADHVCIDKYPSVPKSVRLLNTGKALPFEVTHLPFLNGFNEHVRLDGPELLNIHDIPVDELVGEPIVIEVVW